MGNIIHGKARSNVDIVVVKTCIDNNIVCLPNCKFYAKLRVSDNETTLSAKTKLSLKSIIWLLNYYREGQPTFLLENI